MKYDYGYDLTHVKYDYGYDPKPVKYDYGYDPKHAKYDYGYDPKHVKYDYGYYPKHHFPYLYKLLFIIFNMLTESNKVYISMSYLTNKRKK